MARYETLITVLLALGGVSISHRLQSRLLRNLRLEFQHVYLVVLACTAAWGAATSARELLRPPSPAAVAIAIPLGLLAGHASVRADRALLRRLRATRKVWIGGAGVADSPVRGRPLAVREGARDRTISVITLVVVAALEEVIYRGILTQMALSLSPTLAAVSLAAVTLLFAVSHIHYGLDHVVAKAPLGLFALVSVLAAGTVCAAVIAHGYFNVMVWRWSRRRAPVVSGVAPARRIPI